MKITSIALVAALAPAFGASSATVTADFSKEIARFRPALHSASYGPLYERAHAAFDEQRIREMNFDFVRTHDLALINCGARIFDNHFVFPLSGLDATKPENYYFEPTDFMVKLMQEMNLKIFYRLGSSIEHTGTNHFNCAIPADFDKVAESFAGTVRHYARGWAGGMKDAVSYWEIWNEPDGNNTMWCLPEGDEPWAPSPDDLSPSDRAKFERRRDSFVKFFVTVLKRLKGEFPEQKIGGPALCSMKESWFRPLLRACKREGLRPDFLSWHCYGNTPDTMFKQVEQAEKMCREEGFEGLEFINNEWHYIPHTGWYKMNAATRAPDDANDINSACYTLQVLSRLQTSRYDQAYFYGCRHYGNWGYRSYAGNVLNKNFYALKTFGEIKRDCTAICASSSADTSITAFAAKSADGKKGVLLVSDFCGRGMSISVAAKGLENATNVSARVLSFEKNLEPVKLRIADGKFTLHKPDGYSTAFIVTFDL